MRVIDENCDGFYGSQPLTWQYFGLTEGYFHPEFDSLVIGDSERALPWSEYVQVPEVKGTWYKLEAQDSGTAFAATPVKLDTGRLQLAYEGPPVTWLVVRGEGQFANAYFDVLAGGKDGVEVPVGTYWLYAGEVRKGKKQQAAKALILPPSTPLSWKVAAGATTKVELGGPFGFDFKASRTQDGVTVLGKSVVVIGARGERYERPWNCVARPEVSVPQAGREEGRNTRGNGRGDGPERDRRRRPEPLPAGRCLVPAGHDAAVRRRRLRGPADREEERALRQDRVGLEVGPCST